MAVEEWNTCTFVWPIYIEFGPYKLYKITELFRLAKEAVNSVFGLAKRTFEIKMILSFMSQKIILDKKKLFL